MSACLLTWLSVEHFIIKHLIFFTVITLTIHSSQVKDEQATLSNRSGLSRYTVYSGAVYILTWLSVECFIIKHMIFFIVITLTVHSPQVKDEKAILSNRYGSSRLHRVYPGAGSPGASAGT